MYTSSAAGNGSVEAYANIGGVAWAQTVATARAASGRVLDCRPWIVPCIGVAPQFFVCEVLEQGGSDSFRKTPVPTIARGDSDMVRSNTGLYARVGKCCYFAAGLLAIASCAAAQPETPNAKTDAHGDALPQGALARLGTQRWRHASAVTFVAFLPDGKAVLTGGLDNTLRLWERATGKELRRFAAPPVQAALQQPGQVLVMMAGAGGGRSQPVVAVSKDGKMLAAGVGNNMIQLWEVESGKEIRQFKAPQCGASTMVFAPDAKMLAVRGGDRSITLLETETGKEIRTIKGKQGQGPLRVVIVNGQFFGGGNAGGLEFAPDGKTLASTETEFDQQKANSFVKLTAVDTGEEVPDRRDAQCRQRGRLFARRQVPGIRHQFDHSPARPGYRQGDPPDQCARRCRGTGLHAGQQDPCRQGTRSDDSPVERRDR